MKRYLLIILLLALASILPACGNSTAEQAETTSLVVTHGDSEVTYTLEELQAFPAASVEAEGATFTGVPLADLLQAAGLDPASLSSVNAVATDGFSATYEPDLIMSPNTIIAYEQDGADLPQDAQPLRMVLPDQPGRLNVRMLVRLEAVQ